MAQRAQALHQPSKNALIAEAAASYAAMPPCLCSSRAVSAFDPEMALLAPYPAPPAPGA